MAIPELRNETDGGRSVRLCALEAERFGERLDHLERVIVAQVERPAANAVDGETYTYDSDDPTYSGWTRAKLDAQCAMIELPD